MVYRKQKATIQVDACDYCDDDFYGDAVRHKVETFANVYDDTSRVILEFCSFTCVSKFFEVIDDSVNKRIQEVVSRTN